MTGCYGLKLQVKKTIPFTAESRTCCAITGHNLWFEMGFAHRIRRFIMAKPVTITVQRAVNSNKKTIRASAGRLRAWIVIMLTMLSLSACGMQDPGGLTDKAEETADFESDNVSGKKGASGEQDPSEGLHKIDSLKPDYAEQFTIDHYEGGYSVININEVGSFLVADPDMEVPELFRGMTLIRRPADRIYLASSSSMDFFRALDCLDRVALTATKAADWSLWEVRQLIESGDILYAGKYSTPDYELLLEEECQLAIENTMIYHNPETKELIEKLGIPVLVERSSYESHPLGRMEWIKVYGCLLGKEDEAESFFNEEVRRLEEEFGDQKYGKSAVFFYITAGGYVNVRMPGDYVCGMIELAGGDYALNGLMKQEEGAFSAVNITMEEFYVRARDADILIYNSTIDGEIDSLEELSAENSLFSDFRAFKEGNIWKNESDMFQEATRAVEMTEELRAIFSGETTKEDEFRFFHRMKAKADK